MGAAVPPWSSLNWAVLALLCQPLGQTTVGSWIHEWKLGTSLFTSGKDRISWTPNCGDKAH